MNKEELNIIISKTDSLDYVEFEQSIIYSEKEVEELLHRAVNDSHCKKGRVKHSNSDECAEFVNGWFKLNKKK